MLIKMGGGRMNNLGGTDWVGKSIAEKSLLLTHSYHQVIEEKLKSLIPPYLYKLIEKYPNSNFVKRLVLKITGLELQVLPGIGSTVMGVTRITQWGEGLWEFSIIQAFNVIRISEEKLSE